MQLITLPGAEVLEGQLDLAIAPQWLLDGADIAGVNRKLIAHGQFVAAGLNLEIAAVSPVTLIDLHGV
ncbi:hypothetical protein D3C78_1419170 [compost metagenome]